MLEIVTLERPVVESWRLPVMDDDYLLTIRSGGSPELFLYVGLPGAVLAFVLGLLASVVLGVHGELAAAGLAAVASALPLAIVGPLALRSWRRYRRFEHTLQRGQRVWGQALAVERGLGRWRRRGGAFVAMRHEGTFVNGTVQVRFALPDGSLRDGTCKGWYRSAELEALLNGAPAPIIYVPGVDEVIVAAVAPRG